MKVSDKEVRVISGYGPQESWPEEERMPFFLALEEEITKAELGGKSIILGFDANSKLGPDLIPQDPHKQSANGKILAGILERHALVVVNGLKEKCTGAITRERNTVNGTERSIIDLMIISGDMVDDLVSLHVDEEKNHSLTTMRKNKKGKPSDHNCLIGKFDFKWSRGIKKHKTELFNFKNESGIAKFKELTSNTDILSSIVNKNSDINIATKKFIKRINGYLHKCFKKKKKKCEVKNKDISKLFDRRRILRSKTDDDSKIELGKVEAKLAEKCDKENYIKIKNELVGIESDEGGYNAGKFWKLKKKLCPKNRDPPTAMLDKQGNLVTGAKGIEKLTVEHYIKVLENRIMINKNMEHLKVAKEDLCQKRLELCKLNKSDPWTMDQLDIVLAYLKKNSLEIPLAMLMNYFVQILLD